VAINVRLDRTFPGFGMGVRNDTVYYQAGIALSGTSAQTSPIPATSTILGTTAGKIRIKIYNFTGTTPNLLAVAVYANDATNSVNIFNDFIPTNTGLTLVGSTSKWYDRFFDYLLDTSSTVTSGANGTAGQLLVGGATSFSVITILSGTSCAASMDLEIVPLV